jgi:hypothetical protein
MNPQDILSQLDEVQQHLRTTLAIADLLSLITDDSLLENTARETGSFLASSIQRCIKILETVHTSCHALIEEEYPNAHLPNYE